MAKLFSAFVSRTNLGELERLAGWLTEFAFHPHLISESWHPWHCSLSITILGYTAQSRNSLEHSSKYKIFEQKFNNSSWSIRSSRSQMFFKIGVLDLLNFEEHLFLQNTFDGWLLLKHFVSTLFILAKRMCISKRVCMRISYTRSITMAVAYLFFN